MNKVFVLMGKSGSGKSTLEGAIDLYCVNISKTVSVTTRPCRSYEIDGKDYHFISEEEFSKMLNEGNELLEHTRYEIVDNTSKRIVYYGTCRKDIVLSDKNYVTVLNPHGYRQLVESLGKENVVGIYIDRDDRSRVISSLKRDNNNFKTVLEEAVRRFKLDEEDFEGIEEECDYVIENDSTLASMLDKFTLIYDKEVNHLCL